MKDIKLVQEIKEKINNIPDLNILPETDYLIIVMKVPQDGEQYQKRNLINIVNMRPSKWKIQRERKYE